MLSLGMAALTNRYDMEPEQTDFRIVDLERAWNMPSSQEDQVLIVRNLTGHNN